MMKQHKTVELFLALGLAATIGACSTPTPDNNTANPATQESPAAPVTTAEGGEGGAEPPAFQDKLTSAELVKALQAGGYIIYFRHAQTEKDYADQVNAKMGNCSTQRMLSEKGWQQSKEIGQAFESLKIPVGEVYSSEYCRAWQTADLAFGSHKADAKLNFPPAEEYTPEQKAQMKEAVMPFLTAIPASETNTVIVGHDDVFDAATGIYPEPQGVAYILKPNVQGGFEIVANVLPDEWTQLQ